MKKFFSGRRLVLRSAFVVIMTAIFWFVSSSLSNGHEQVLASYPQFAQARQQIMAKLDTKTTLQIAKGASKFARRIGHRDFQTQLNRFYEALDRQDLKASHTILAAMKEKYPNHPVLLLDGALFHLLVANEQQTAALGFIDLLEQQGLNQLESLPRNLLKSIIDVYQKAELWGAGLIFLENLSARDDAPSEMEQLLLGCFRFKLGQFKPALQSLENLLESRPGEVQDYLGSAQALAAQIEMSLGKTEQAIKIFYLAEQSLEELMTQKMRRGEDFHELVDDMEQMQFFMVHQLMSVKAFSVAESILLKLAEKFPSHPEVVNLLDRIRLYKLEISAG